MTKTKKLIASAIAIVAFLPVTLLNAHAGGREYLIKCSGMSPLVVQSQPDSVNRTDVRLCGRTYYMSHWAMEANFKGHCLSGGRVTTYGSGDTTVCRF
jgi:hypothetical protein